MTEDTPESPRLTWSSPRLRLRVLFAALALAFVCYAFFTWVLWPVKVVGDSMLPNYHTGDRYFLNKLAYVSQNPKRGDVIGLRTFTGEVYIKRIVGLPGETIDFTNGCVLINHQRLIEPYVNTVVPWTNAPTGRLGS